MRDHDSIGENMNGTYTHHKYDHHPLVLTTKVYCGKFAWSNGKVRVGVQYFLIPEISD